MKKLIFVSILFFQFCAFSQEDAWVYLTDKEDVASSIANPITILTQKAINRKTKHGVSIDARDVPVNESYISLLKNESGISVLAKSKWFNAVHVRGTEIDIKNLLTNPDLAFIDHIDFADKSLNSSKTSKINKVKSKFHLENSFVDFTYGDTQNQIDMINLDDLHVTDYTGEGVTIGVIDASFTNVNTMGAFQRIRDNGNLLGGYDFVNRTADVYAYDPRPANISHGTQVLSTMAGFIQNNYVGTAPDASYYLFRTEDDGSENPVEESYWVEAAERADSLGVDIINTSLGYLDFDNSRYNYTASNMDGNTAFITKGANIAFQKGLLLVTSAGNSGASGVGAPADSEFVFSIGAVNSSGNYASFSSVGSAIQPSLKPDVVAQGQLPYMINANNTIVQNNGTSFSSPIMAGAVACLMQALPNKTNAEIMQLLRESASQFSTPDYQLGYGIPDFQAALNTALSINDVEEGFSFLLYPNPSKSLVYFKYPLNLSEVKVTLYNIIGKQVKTLLVSKNNNVMDISLLSKGIYIARIESENSSISLKLIKD
ncbi:Por secretion system C-terminal sorting domain-containing protein [Flaviramulus basaltis]|uniref:Por secretion system C-terminal sorting domain-containing protein n=1 Tax=Flaviramulus basaltis TaxID=369401 RepID=A0A1K2IQ60_9FLAO|nr:S8 family serine peptidase [Flaviramulus basaltis]SFZ94589.1 Por secretion system C-terminal sorting domain-containing protein [Flaviramulus basaltis]